MDTEDRDLGEENNSSIKPEGEEEWEEWEKGEREVCRRYLGDRERRSCAHTLAGEVSHRSLHTYEGVTTDRPVDQSNTPREKKEREIQNLHTSTQLNSLIALLEINIYAYTA